MFIGSKSLKYYSSKCQNSFLTQDFYKVLLRAILPTYANNDELLLKGQIDVNEAGEENEMNICFFQLLPEIHNGPKITLELTSLVSTCVGYRKFSFFLSFLKYQ